MRSGPLIYAGNQMRTAGWRATSTRRCGMGKLAPVVKHDIQRTDRPRALTLRGREHELVLEVACGVSGPTARYRAAPGGEWASPPIGSFPDRALALRQTD